MTIRIVIKIDVEGDSTEITQDELTDIESAVEDTLTEYGHKHDIAVAKFE